MNLPGAGSLCSTGVKLSFTVLTLLNLAGGLSDPPTQEASREQVQTLLNNLQVLIKDGATDDNHPWALAHGVLAFGPTLVSQSGRKAIEVLVDHVQSTTVAQRRVYRFPSQTSAGLEVEPHPGMIINILSEVGVPLDTNFKLGTGSVTLAQLIDDARWAFSPPQSEADWHNYPWTAMALFRTASADTIVTRDAELALGHLAKVALEHLAHEQQYLNQLMRYNRPHQLQKRRQGIYGYACGGLHFFNAVIMGAGLFGTEAEHQLARQQLKVLHFRWKAERGLYYRARIENPAYEWLLSLQELKFFGHVLETLVLTQDYKALRSETQGKFFRQVANDLSETVGRLQPTYKMGVALRKSQRRVYNDIIGDGCHAVRAIKTGLLIFYPAPTP